MDRDHALIGLWAMASGCWICLVLLAATASPLAEAGQATYLLAFAPPVLTLISGCLIARVLRGASDDPDGPARPVARRPHPRKN